MQRRFTLVRSLGEGGQGRVVSVRDAARDGQVVALKETLDHRVDMLMEEFSLLDRLRHPHLAVVYDWFRESPLLHEGSVPRRGAAGVPAAYTQEFIDGPNLWAALQGAPLTYCEEVFEQIMRALAYLHALDVLHMDLKPENVLITGIERPFARLLDFGISESKGKSREKVRGTVVWSASPAPTGTTKISTRYSPSMR